MKSETIQAEKVNTRKAFDVGILALLSMMSYYFIFNLTSILTIYLLSTWFGIPFQEFFNTWGLRLGTADYIANSIGIAATCILTIMYVRPKLQIKTSLISQLKSYVKNKGSKKLIFVLFTTLVAIAFYTTGYLLSSQYNLGFDLLTSLKLVSPYIMQFEANELSYVTDLQAHEFSNIVFGYMCAGIVVMFIPFVTKSSVLTVLLLCTVSVNVMGGLSIAQYIPYTQSLSLNAQMIMSKISDAEEKGINWTIKKDKAFNEIVESGYEAPYMK